MATRLDSRLSRLRTRKSDPQRGLVYKNALLEKTEDSLSPRNKAKEYISNSMAEVDANYTKKTFEECQRVQDQLAEACSTQSVPVQFRTQGSVTNNTHIRLHSDVDLLVITDRYVGIQSPLEPTSPYQGNAIADLKEIRGIVEERLVGSYPTAKVDTSGAKAVAISGGSLTRKIDVIPANWLDTSDYRSTNDESFRGVEILDKTPPGTRIKNFPFLHNLELHKKDVDSLGGLKRLIRFVKSARYDADVDPGVSSYDIASLCYHVPLNEFYGNHGNDVGLALAFTTFALTVCRNGSLQDSLQVPNKTRSIFGPKGTTVQNVLSLVEEIVEILQQTNA